MDNENEFNYSVDHQFKQTKPPKKSGFGKTVFIPFLSGVVGASLVLGVTFKVPTVRNALIGDTKPQTSYSAPKKENTSLSDANLTTVSNNSNNAIQVAKTVLPSIVGIEIEYKVSSFWGNSKASATGSGVIISEDGYIITNNHVVSTESSSSSFYTITEATGLKVKLYGDEKEYEAKIIGTDAYTDLAVIKIDATGLTPAVLGDSDELQVGEFAMALGNPLGMDFTVTAGIISAVNREVSASDGTEYLAIQTDAAINSGNSGGALVNSKGEVIGINNLKLSGAGIEGIGFAIPINSTREVVDQLIEFKTVKRPYIGISGTAIDSSITEIYGLPAGISVQEVEKGSPAEAAGLKKGDIITKIEGQEVTTVTELNKVKYTYKIGDTITLTVLRSGKEEELKLTLGEEPAKTEEKEEDKNKEKDNENTATENPTTKDKDSITPSDPFDDFDSIWDLFSR